MHKPFIPQYLRRVLLKQKIKTQHSGYVFLTNEGAPYSPNNPSALKRTFGTACKKAGIEGLRFHDLRHTAATRMIENTGNIVAVSKILGHADIKTTMRYAHPEQSLIEALESLNQVFTERDGHKSGHN
jgi:integrase